MMEERKPLLEVRHLKKYFGLGGKKELKAVDDVSFVIYKGETLELWENQDVGRQPADGPVSAFMMPRAEKYFMMERISGSRQSRNEKNLQERFR